ncbi:5-formyltetrahydrofolate cyclo-ligase [Nannocystis sp. SCPEA4]|nr:5-formyltetrahydrofolate cyclo-ligase [Nannocystis sp. SCPEA4]MCY1055549.1 5-formyltetrahydrofolate cyclo-ligase [Nannocystis sp. SCPEA4]
MLSKADIRAQGAARRRERGSEGVAARSAELCAHVLADPRWRAANSVAAFVGVKGEPDTRPLLIAALAAGKQLWLPRMGGPRRQNIEFVAVSDLVALAPAPFGLLEPREGPGVALADTDVDLVLMPGLAFTRTGVRLGYGKGHYDGATSPLRGSPRPVRIGVCFADELVDSLPEEPHDVGVHALATEVGMIDCTCLQ